jgi:hypothetical protein
MEAMGSGKTLVLAINNEGNCSLIKHNFNGIYRINDLYKIFAKLN